MTITEDRLTGVCVADAMHTGILTTEPTTPLRTVARLMADRSVHAVAVADRDFPHRPWGIVTALDVAAAAAEGADMSAGDIAEEVVTVTSCEPLGRAAQLMAKHRLSHVVVIDAATGHPSGIISDLDVAAAYAA